MDLRKSVDCDSLGDCYQTCQVFKQGMSWYKSLSAISTLLAFSPLQYRLTGIYWAKAIKYQEKDNTDFFLSS